MYDALKSLHVLAIATWFGSSAALTVIGLRLLRSRGTDAFATYLPSAAWWAGRAHPAAGVLLLITGFGMTGDAGISIGEPWILVALIGLIAAMGIGGALIGRTAGELAKSIEGSGGTMPAAQQPQVGKLLLYTRIELVILAVVIVDMVVKPGA